MKPCNTVKPFSFNPEHVNPGRPHGLYAVTAARYPDHERLLAECEAALAGGARLMQFRDKSADAGWRRNVAMRLNDLCRRYQVPLIMNDDVGLAAEVGAAGVHLGQGDAGIAAAVAALGAGSIIGVSCHNRIELAEAAAGQGATYLAFGSMFSSLSKPEAVLCTTQTLTAARRFDLPLVAIGGITAENGGSLIAAGADYLAVISAVFDAPDVRAAAQRIAALWPSS